MVPRPKLTMINQIRELQARRPLQYFALLLLLPSGIFAISVSAQTVPGKPATLKRIEPGLEDAVKWEWHVAPSDDKDWGFQLPDPTPAPTPSGPALSQPENRPAVYEVQR